MTKPPDYENALKAALIVAKMTGPPFRYQVAQEHVNWISPPVALTLTKWAAWQCADAIGSGLTPPGKMTVLDMDGNFVARPDDLPVAHRSSS